MQASCCEAILVVVGAISIAANASSLDEAIVTGYMKATSVKSVLTRSCLGNDVGDTGGVYGIPHEDVAANRISGIFIRTHCEPPEVVLWYESLGRAYWVNPYITLAGITDGVMAVTTNRDITSAVTSLINSAVKKMKSVSVQPPPDGCINPGSPTNGSCDV
ncbi:envelope glycoprotein L [Spheniscid alphaherpesvirus 1]|uniref:Envelope glycoprotein L n=1 Tax=Spheniscid alphaherpesvirus 1 TaxID=2560777 RepID=A0A1R3TB06_9ALPH|nr:envelope glycoprotein L [Spheniscid alphaherpesvirus 1]SCO83609.1 envelope glycoprotein L [Spheniscid alphaherpesvirus 1]